MAASMNAYSTPVRRSPRLLARMLAQPSGEASQSLGTPQRKRSLQDPVQLQPSKRARPYSVFLESLVVAVGASSSLHFDQSYCGDKAVLVVTKARLHEHPPAGYISRIRLVLEDSGTYQLQVCMLPNCYY